jgi:hypothetical protein
VIIGRLSKRDPALQRQVLFRLLSSAIFQRDLSLKSLARWTLERHPDEIPWTDESAVTHHG